MLKIALETVYKGVTFRSRTEARWAVFFDSLGLRWEYEPQFFALRSGNYLPDFRVWYGDEPHWFEVKATEEDLHARDLGRLLEFNESIAEIHILDGWPRFDVFMTPPNYGANFNAKDKRFGDVLLVADELRIWKGEYASSVVGVAGTRYVDAVKAAQCVEFVVRGQK